MTAGAFVLARQHPDLPSVGESRLLVVSGLVLTASTLAALVLQAADMAGGANPGGGHGADADVRDGVAEIGRNIVLQAVGAVLVLGLVAWFGTLAPPNDGRAADRRNPR